jgi:hypothetical protein
VKDITFENEDTIGLGLNNNENKWRVRNGLLEIIDSKDRIFSRFAYDKSKKAFIHTNDSDTLSIKGQTLTPK